MSGLARRMSQASIADSVHGADSEADSVVAGNSEMGEPPAPELQGSRRASGTRGRGGGRGQGKAAASSARSVGSVGTAAGRGKAGSKAGEKSRKNKKRKADAMFDFARSFLKADESTFTVPAYGTVMSCSICTESSNEAEGWGRTVRVRKEGGQYGVQPFGDSCKKHFLFHRKRMGWMPWDRFQCMYHESDTFKEAVDERGGS